MFHVSPAAVAKGVGSRAEVVALATGPATRALADALPDRFEVYGGACRVWWPGLAVDDSPYDHPIIWVKSGGEAAAERRLVAMVNEHIEDAARLYRGDQVVGTVVSVDANGAAVDLGASGTAYVHRNYLVPGQGVEPAEVVRVGQRVTALVGEVTDDQVRLDVGAFIGDPWVNAAEQAHPGDVVRGRFVRRNANGGLLVELLPGVRGVVPPVRQNAAASDLRPGQVAAFRLVGIDVKGARADLSLIDAPAGTTGAVPLRALEGGPVFLAEVDEDIEGASNEVERLRGRVRDLEAQLEAMGHQLRAADELAKRLRSQLRQTRERQARRNNVAQHEADPARDEPSFVAALAVAHEALYPEHDRLAYPLGQVRLGDRFLETVRDLEGISRGKIVDACVHVAANRAHEIAGLELHQLHTGPGGAPQLVRDDGARAWRVSLQVHSKSARRMHFWVLRGTEGRVVEFDSVHVHDAEIR